MEFINVIDQSVVDFMQSLHGNVLNAIMRVFTYLGESGFIWIALAIALICIPKTRRLGIFLALTLVAEYLFNDMIIKHLVARERPFTTLENIDTVIKHPHGYSFPSGHSSAAFSSATAIFMHKKRWGIAAFVLATLIALSRVYFCVHYVTDVLAGALVGIIIGILVYKLLIFIERKHKAKKLQDTPDKNPNEEM